MAGAEAMEDDEIHASYSVYGGRGRDARHMDRSIHYPNLRKWRFYTITMQAITLLYISGPYHHVTWRHAMPFPLPSLYLQALESARRPGASPNELLLAHIVDAVLVALLSSTPDATCQDAENRRASTASPP